MDITGTTTITGLGTVNAGTRRICHFDGALTLTHNATSLILPTGGNITTAAGDVATFVSLGSGNWLCVGYMKADGTALASSGGSTVQLPMITIPAIPDTETKSFVVKDNEAYLIGAGGQVVRYNIATGHPILNSDNGSLKYYDTLNSVGTTYSGTSITSSDDYIYATTTTANTVVRTDMSAKTDTTMTISGSVTTFAANSCITSDGTNLFILEANTTKLLKYSVSGTTMTYVETVTLSTASIGSDYSSALISNGILYYCATDTNVADTILKFELSTLTETVLGMDAGMSANSLVNAYSADGRAFFEWNGHVQMLAQTHDSEDETGIKVYVID